MSKHILIALFLLPAMTLMSQFEVRVKTGLLANKTHFNDGLEIVDQISSSSITPLYSLTGRYTLNPQWSIQTGATWSDRRSTLGASVDVNLLGLNIPIGVSTDLSIKSVDIPLSINYHIPIGNGGSIYPHVGVIGSFVTDAILQPEVNTLLDIRLPEVALPMDEINRQVIHGLVGLGYEYKIDGKNKIFGEAQYNHALESATDIGIIQTNIKNKGFSVGIGYAMSF